MLGLELLATHKVDNGIAVCLKPRVAPILTHSLAREIRLLQNALAEQFYNKPWNDIFYIVWYLFSGNIPWRGLDFGYIHHKLITGKEEDFLDYIHDVFNLLFLNYISLGLPLINCSLVTRPLTGISKEFFLLNQINFFKKHHPDGEGTNHEYFEPMSKSHHINSGCFPEKIYSRNAYYHFSHFNFSSMRKIICQSPYKEIDKGELIKIQSIFELIKKNTLVEIYLIASKKPKLLERLSKVHLAQHMALSSNKNSLHLSNWLKMGAFHEREN